MAYSLVVLLQAVVYTTSKCRVKKKTKFKKVLITSVICFSFDYKCHFTSVI